MKKTVRVEQWVEIEVDELKFTDSFMAEFRHYLYPFSTIEDHIKHLAQLKARGMLSDSFVEGYGPPSGFGLQAEIVGQEEDIEA